MAFKRTIAPVSSFYLILNVLAYATSAAPLSQAACDRTILVQAADTYVAAQTAGSLDPLKPVLATSWIYTENNKNISTNSSVLSKKLTIDHRRTNYDLVTCATYTEIVAASGPYVIGTQIRHDTNGKISSIDTISSTTGSWLFNATKTLEYVKAEDAGWKPLPVAAQSAREFIQAAGDAYLDMWNNAHAHEKVPWGTPCVRLEGSAYTGKGQANDSCQPGIPSNHNQAPNTRRRYVIDQEMGSVSIFCVWEHMMNAADSHEFRLENGKLRYVHTMTECGGRTCRL
ncbi:hypothetical protein P171DRAFT_458688 [Karstenula rhodostoma CBS 690.94]|uniref:DUF8021 domain-containing protein n=1 Tax=Karstenula rhodostoma CBS 690.94 TaxID=1392251 RepID=A0A9P4U527_9PLEO|nr:hypothetical protein P171DRAFT_458688 [Karstenula rhodostoma CBS 690.94]